MRKYLLAAVAAVAISSPALARDGSPYVGIEGGMVIDGDIDLDFDGDFGYDDFSYDDAFDLDFGRGLDIDAIAGYDFGMFRLEGELGYKRLNLDKVDISDELAGEGFDEDDLDDFGIEDADGSVLSLMANGLFDFGDDSGWNGYVGGGIGRARVKFEGERDSAFAWQFIAGARTAISDTIDVGLKYRYFRTGKLEFNDEFDIGDGVASFGLDGKLRTHSLLASLIFNFAPPPPPPPPVVVAPPPPPPPATQTCPDGTVILATDMCPPPPEPYVPPPPPEPTPERG